MKPDRPNVLLLTVDALRADRVSVNGYGRPTTPRLEALAERGIVCEQATSNSAFTQPSVASFLSSSRPLDHGGFDDGCRGRPRNVFRFFGDAGYETILIATFPWVSRYYGYGPVDREVHLFIINSLLGTYGSGLMSSALRSWHQGEASLDATVDRIEPAIGRLFDDLEDYCRARLDPDGAADLDFPDSPLANAGYDYARVGAVVGRHRREFRRDKRAYLARHLRQVPRGHQWLGHAWRYCRTPAKLFDEALFRTTNGLLGVAAPRLARLRRHRFKRYVDGASLADFVLREIAGRRHSDRPFFLWTHFVDTHLPYCAGRGRRWYRETPRHLKTLGYPPDLDLSIGVGGKPRTAEAWDVWSALYDAAIAYTDEQIGRIVDGLAELGLRDRTLIAVAGDHGEELGEHGDISHHFRLYEHNVRVPMLFHSPGLGPERIDGLTTLLDLVPSLAVFAGLTPDRDWAGVAVTDAAVKRRSHVVLETFHGGSCLFDRRPPYLAVRTRRWKYLWKEYRDPTDRFSPDGPELYEIATDPAERDNRYRPDDPLVAEFNAIVARRLAEIPEIGRERIVAALGEEAVRRAAETGPTAALAGDP